MAKFASITFAAFQKLLAAARRNGYVSLAERIHQDTAPSRMQGRQWWKRRHKVPKVFQRSMDLNKPTEKLRGAERKIREKAQQRAGGPDRIVIPRNDFKNLVEAATAKKKAKNPRMESEAGFELGEIRGRTPGLIRGESTEVPGGGRNERTYARPSVRTPNKKTLRAESEMDLAARRAQLRTLEKPVDVFDYLLSKPPVEGAPVRVFKRGDPAERFAKKKRSK